jgi:hypothetical protein
VPSVTPAQFQAILEEGTLLKRLPTLAELADTAAFIASDRAGAMTATVANLSAGSMRTGAVGKLTQRRARASVRCRRGPRGARR